MENVMFLRIIGLFTLLIIESKQCELSTKHCSCEYIQSGVYVQCAMTTNNYADIQTHLMQLVNISLVRVQGGNFLPLLHRLNVSLNAVTVLDLSHSSEKKHIEQDTFKYCQRLEHIRLHDYNIRSISMRAFSVLQRLRVLDLSDNSFLSFTTIFEALGNLHSPNLKCLNISGAHNAEFMQPAIVEPWMLKQLQNTTLKELDMSWTRLLMLKASTTFVPYLKSLDLSGTFISGSLACLSTILSHSNIETIKLDYWPNWTRRTDGVARLGQSSHLIKREETWDCMKQDINTTKGCFILPQSVRNIYIRFINADNFYIFFKKEMCFHTNNVEKFIMSGMSISKPIGSLKGLHNLTFLDLSHLNILRLVPAFYEKMFWDMPSLQILLISDSGLNRISFQSLSQIFSHNPIIKYIDISNNELEKLPPYLIINNTLLEVFNVSFNQLEIFILDMSKNNHLKEIDLRYNNIRYFEENILSTLSNFGRTLSIYLPTKYFDCKIWECKYEFLHLLNVTLTCSIETVSFRIHSNQSKSNLSLPNNCEPDISKGNQLHSGWIVGIATIVIIVIVIGIIAIWLYRRYKPDNPKDITVDNTHNSTDDSVFLTISGEKANYNRNLKFVAFLSYSHLDTDFVIQRIYKPLNKKLKALLPQHNPFSLIIVNDKDFLPGEPIDQLIEEAVSNSCVTIAVVSNDFANSMWCHFEVLTALTANVPIIPIYLNECDPSLLKGSLKVIYNSRVRLMWPDTPELENQSEEDKVIDVLVKSILRHIPFQVKRSSSDSPSFDGSNGTFHRPS